MPGASTIEWTEATWNPVTGCTKVSPGCAHCYAETFAERWRGVPGHPYSQGFDLKLWPERLEHPIRWKRPRLIFVNSMSDLFHEDVPAEYIREVFEVMARANQHIYQVLTKRHQRMAELAPTLPWPDHVWMGVTIENRRFVHRASYLRQVPAQVRFISAEPLLGFLEGLDLTGIAWVIAGGESGPRHRPVKAEWIRHVRDLCLENGVRFFFKQWGGIRAKAGGRRLDGREWNGMPQSHMPGVLAPTGPPMGSRSRPQDLPDGADEKWVYTEHTKAKHEILTRYLDAWLPILGRRTRGSSFQHKQLYLVDGFAGRGRYMGDESGSPAIMFERAKRAVQQKLTRNVLIRCAEPDEVNFGHLREVCAGLRHSAVQVRPTQETFDEMATKLANWAEKEKSPPPTFVMVDPYGVTGVKLETLRRLLAIGRLEVLLTFMVRDPSRFLREPNYDAPLTAFFGGKSWQKCEDATDRPACLLLRFREIVCPSIARYATAFRVFEDERKTTLYYLVHLTNSDLGMREMKEAMVKQSGDMTFWPVTHRPPNQIELDLHERAPYPSLQAHLAQRFAGNTLTFKHVLNLDYPGGVWVEKNYRKAILAMEKAAQSVVKVERPRVTPSGRSPSGLGHEDIISFL